jgi:hypothetical protein
MIISDLIDKAHLSSVVNAADELYSVKVSENLNNAARDVTKVNDKIGKLVNQTFNVATKAGSVDLVAKQVDNLMNNYLKDSNKFDDDAFAILNIDPSEKVATTSAPTDLVKNSKKTAEKLNNNLEEIKKLKEEAPKKKSAEKKIEKVIRKEEKELNKLAKQVKKVDKKIEKNEKAIEKLAKDPEIKDEKVKEALNNSLNQIQQYSTAVKDVKSQIEKEKEVLKSFK